MNKTVILTIYWYCLMKKKRDFISYDAFLISYSRIQKICLIAMQVQQGTQVLQTVF